jgi:hypothetical protein
MPCPVNCEASWSLQWSACDADGYKFKTYTVTTQSANGGIPCEAENGAQLTGTCPRDCVGDWGGWSDCVAGTRTNIFYVQIPKQHSGAPCVAEHLQQDVENCDIDCAGSWGDWSGCSGGIRTQTYTVTQQAYNDGIPCPVELVKIDRDYCPQPVDCVSEWSTFTACDSLTGIKNKTYTIFTPAANGGAACETYNGAVISQDCPVDCVGDFGAGYGACDPVLGKKTKVFSITTPTLNGGQQCSYADGQAVTIDCDIDCVATWSDWSSCVNGYHNRTYFIQQEAVNNGAPCLMQTGGIDYETCLVDCVGSWGNWTACEEGDDTRSRMYTVEIPPANGGAPCPANNTDTETAICLQDGARDCIGSWTWTQDCDPMTGIRVRTYYRTQEKLGNGIQCEAEHLQEDPVACDVDGVGPWRGWSACGASGTVG